MKEISTLEIAKAPIEILIEGGPCSGKTTLMSSVIERYSNLGYRVCLSPEAATFFMDCGIENIPELGTKNRPYYLEVEKELLRFMLEWRNTQLRLAEKSGDLRQTIIFWDRGPHAIINGGYTTSKEGHVIHKELGYPNINCFDAAIHLVTAALGAEAFYGNATNLHRTESLEVAREIDRRIQKSLVGVEHIYVIDNSTDFKSKMYRAHETIAHILGIPVPLEIEWKFALPPKLNDPKLWTSIDHFVVSHIEQKYLRSDSGREVRIRMRTQGESSMFYYTEKIPTKIPGTRGEINRKISAREYEDFSAMQDPATRTIRKLRSCFLWGNQYYELDRYIEPVGVPPILEVELTKDNDAVNLPPCFKKVAVDVTGNTRYSNYEIARR